jgi:hypothetical protein
LLGISALLLIEKWPYFIHAFSNTVMKLTKSLLECVKRRPKPGCSCFALKFACPHF